MCMDCCMENDGNSQKIYAHRSSLDDRTICDNCEVQGKCRPFPGQFKYTRTRQPQPPRLLFLSTTAYLCIQ